MPNEYQKSYKIVMITSHPKSPREEHREVDIFKQNHGSELTKKLKHEVEKKYLYTHQLLIIRVQTVSMLTSNNIIYSKEYLQRPREFDIL